MCVIFKCMKKRTTPNLKPRLISSEQYFAEKLGLEQLAKTVSYGGNAEHKRNRGDFSLSPPFGPRTSKTLCDEAQVFTREKALFLLREGIRRGLVSEQRRNGWPQNVWAVADNGVPLAAQLENRDRGVYHGYPMLADEPQRDEILKRWREHEA